jgi:hypothetical protein
VAALPQSRLLLGARSNQGSLLLLRAIMSGMPVGSTASPHKPEHSPQGHEIREGSCKSIH